MSDSSSDWLELFQQIATEHGGVCLSHEYINQRNKLEFRCSEGHTFSALPNNVYHRGSWCPHCSRNAKLSLKDVKRHAAKFGGKCLSTSYKNENAKLKFQCNNGHIFSATTRSLKSQNCFCSQCRKLTIEEFSILADSIGYTLVSKRYKNNSTHLNFKCSNGHHWRVQPKHIKEGRRCPQCN